MRILHPILPELVIWKWYSIIYFFSSWFTWKIIDFGNRAWCQIFSRRDN